MYEIYHVLPPFQNCCRYETKFSKQSKFCIHTLQISNCTQVAPSEIQIEYPQLRLPQRDTSGSAPGLPQSRPDLAPPMELLLHAPDAGHWSSCSSLPPPVIRAPSLGPYLRPLELWLWALAVGHTSSGHEFPTSTCAMRIKSSRHDDAGSQLQSSTR